jgi:hypothetical protein
MMGELQDQAIRQHCKMLRMPTIGGQFARLAEAATREGQSHVGYLEALLAAEMEERESRAITRLLHEARLPRMKTLEAFEFDRSGVSAGQLRTLAEGDYMTRAEPILLVGEAGTGKTHVSTAMPDPRPRGRRVEHHYLTRRSDRGSGSAPMRRCRTVAILSLGSGAVGVSSTESSPASRRRDEEARTRPGQARVKRLWRHDRLRIKHMAASPRISPASRRRTSWVSEQLASTSPSAAIMLPASSTMDAHTQSRSAFALRPTVSAA